MTIRRAVARPTALLLASTFLLFGCRAGGDDDLLPLVALVAPVPFVDVAQLGAGVNDYTTTCGLRADGGVVCFGSVDRVGWATTGDCLKPKINFDDPDDRTAGHHGAMCKKTYHNKGGAMLQPFAITAGGLPHMELLFTDGTSKGLVGQAYHDHMKGQTLQAGQTLLGTGWASASRKVVAGDHYSCRLKTDATVHCWGEDPMLSYNDKTGDHSDKGLSPPSDLKFKDICAGSIACGVKTDGSLYCWRPGNPLKLDGLFDAFAKNMPSGQFERVFCTGQGVGCALDAAGTATCWTGTGAHASTSVLDAPSLPLRRIAFMHGGGSACAIDRQFNTVVCWGKYIKKSVPVSGKFTRIAGGKCHWWAVRDDGVLVPIKAGGCISTNWGGPGWGEVSASCTVTPDDPKCVESVCGDGKVEGYEQCDDGNKLLGDGCTAACTVNTYLLDVK